MEIKRTLILLNKIDVQELVDENLVMADSIMMIRAVVYGVLIATTTCCLRSYITCNLGTDDPLLLLSHFESLDTFHFCATAMPR